jgi:hypothetical protein
MKSLSMTQPQLEALVDLLVLAMHADGRYSITEQDAFEQDLSTLPWDSGIALRSYVQASYTRARSANASQYLNTLCRTFDTAQVRHEAFVVIENMLSIDGTAPTESDFMTQLRNELHLP